MCKLGDIIVIKEFKDATGEVVSKHSFVVINDETNFVEGLKYDFVSNMLCSFKSEEHKNRKLKYKSNIPIKEEHISGKHINAKEGYIRADELYYFDKNEIEYQIIAHMDGELLDELVQLILLLHENKKLKVVTTNLKKITN